MPRGGVFLNKKSFTLSEVLITLAIIGIIAAITIPVIIANYQEKSRISKIRKTYSTLANAMTYVKINNGDSIFEEDIKDSQEIVNSWFNEYLKPYIATTKICYDEEGCWAQEQVKYLNGSYNLNSRKGIGIGTKIVTAVLNDGTFIEVNSAQYNFCDVFKVNCKTNKGISIYFDINGDKGPNTIGKDIFIAVFTDNGLKPAYSEALDEVETECSSKGRGYSCLIKYLGL